MVEPAANALRAAVRVCVVALIGLTSASVRPRPWQVYAFQDGSYKLVSTQSGLLSAGPGPFSEAPPVHDSAWRVSEAHRADVTGDGRAEWVLLAWRPWRDWPIQQWLHAPSPIASFRGDTGESCHVVVLDASDGREVWVGSALPVPLTTLAVGDVDGDGHNEVIALEGDYHNGIKRSATRVDVWSWKGFGFVLEWRSDPILVQELRLLPASRSGILTIAVR